MNSAELEMLGRPDDGGDIFQQFVESYFEWENKSKAHDVIGSWVYYETSINCEQYSFQFNPKNIFLEWFQFTSLEVWM